MKLGSVFIFFFVITAYGQSGREYVVSTVLFYNVENLFDTIDDPETRDDARTPSGKYKWTSRRYKTKLERIAEVVGQNGSSGLPGPADIIGLCEVENQEVINDLVEHPSLVKFDYGIIHFNSPDERGIDVCLLYRKSRFLPTAFNSHELVLYEPYPFRKYTRDQLVVTGILDSEEISFIVVHWPSRGGGEALTRPYRKAAAQLTCTIVDSLKREIPDPRIIIMGDFNDNPPDKSIRSILLCGKNTTDPTSNGFYNPMEKLYKRGVGSLAYRDRWSLFDQFIVTSNMLDKHDGSYKFWKAGVFSPSQLLTRRGRYKGYPFRTFAAGVYQGGYSDHLPIYLHLIRELTDTNR